MASLHPLSHFFFLSSFSTTLLLHFTLAIALQSTPTTHLGPPPSPDRPSTSSWPSHSISQSTPTIPTTNLGPPPSPDRPSASSRPSNVISQSTPTIPTTNLGPPPSPDRPSASSRPSNFISQSIPTIPSTHLSPPPSPSVPNTVSYIIHTDESSRPSNFISQTEWYSFLIQSLLPPEPRILYTYQTALHGFTAVLTREQAEKLSKSHGVIGVYKDELIQLQTTHTPNFLGLNTDFGLWQDSNFGDDVIIGLLDTGIWPESHSFDDTGLNPVSASWRGQCENGARFNSTMCNNKLIGARFFYSGAEEMMLKDPNEFESPRDRVGHGTHTASTAAGSRVTNASLYGFARGTASGIAPKAKIAMYKVCWNQSNCAMSDLLAGIEKSIEDGVHILSISIGSKNNTPYELDAIAVGTFSAMRHGIFVAASAGNHGDLSTVCNSVPWVTTVAAGMVDRTFIDNHTIIGKNRAPMVASFSSRGPNPLMPRLLKPDILAPGSNILASWPSESPLTGDKTDLRRSDFNVLSGTSMACPHVAGMAALIKNVHPDWSLSMIQSAMMTTAFTLDNRHRPIIDDEMQQDATPLAMGSGHIFPQAASDPGLVYESGFEDYVNWLCSMNYTSDQMKKFVPWPVDCSGVMGDKNWDLNYPSFAVLFDKQTSDYVLRTRILTKVSKYPESYTVRVVNMRPDKVDVAVSPTILDFVGINEKRSYRVEFKNKIGINMSSTEYEYAYIIWENEEHQVKSPVVFMWNYVP